LTEPDRASPIAKTPEAGLQRQRLCSVVTGADLLRHARARLHEAFGVKRNAAVQPSRRRISTDEKKQMPDRPFSVLA
jgi:hypothetical protein